MYMGFPTGLRMSLFYCRTSSSLGRGDRTRFTTAGFHRKKQDQVTLLPSLKSVFLETEPCKYVKAAKLNVIQVIIQTNWSEPNHSGDSALLLIRALVITD